jgi:hypothetical protein
MQIKINPETMLILSYNLLFQIPVTVTIFRQFRGFSMAFLTRKGQFGHEMSDWKFG